MKELYDECDAGIAGGCGACEKCDPVWWRSLKHVGKLKEQILKWRECIAGLERSKASAEFIRAKIELAAKADGVGKCCNDLEKIIEEIEKEMEN
jgi:hypothetical protein